jgi:uncharacterized membrane protein SirB2
MSYLALKHVHMTAVVLSLALFGLRGLWMASDSPRLAARWVKVVPHVIDTVLLLSALALAATLGQWPFAQPWLTVKVVLLVVYIGLGMVALKPGRPKRVRIAAFLLALATFLFLVSVARAHDPWGALAPFVR